MNGNSVFTPWNKYEEDLEIYHKRFLEGQFKEMCFQKVMDLDVSCAYSEEPVPFAEIGKLPFQPITIGCVWARKNFACAWFHLCGTLPENVSREELYLDFENDGEALLVDQDGSALKGFTAGSLVFGVVDHSVEKLYYPLADLIDEEGNIELYLDGASNSLLGEYVNDCSKLKTAAVVRRNPKMLDLFLDFDVLLDYTMLKEGKPFLTPEQSYQIYRRSDLKNLEPVEFNYGYAITGHRAQGSEWGKVLVFEERFPFDKEEHARWLYTAATRASEKLVLVR